MSRRPLSIAELAARSRPTGYDSSRSLKDLLRIATTERDTGDAAKAASDVDSAFIHYAKASTLMLEELPTHPRFGELTSTQKEAIILHGELILDSLGKVKVLVNDRFCEWRSKYPDADLSTPVPTPTPQRQRERQEAHKRAIEERRRQERQQTEADQRRQEERRTFKDQEIQRLTAELERRQRMDRFRKDGVAYDKVASLTARTRLQQDRHEAQEKERLEREELLAEKKRTQEAALNAAAAAAFLGYPTPASLRVRPESYEGQTQTQPVSIVSNGNPHVHPPPSAPPVSIPQAHQFVGLERSASVAGVVRTDSAARVQNPHHASYPPASGPPPGQDKSAPAPSRTGSRADHHPHHSSSKDHRPVSDPRSRENPPVSGSREHPTRPGSRADHRAAPAIRTELFGVRNESAPAVYGTNSTSYQSGRAATAAAQNAAYGPGIAYGQNLGVTGTGRARKASAASPTKDRTPGGGVNGIMGSHPPTTHAPVPRRRTNSYGPQAKGMVTAEPRANGVVPDTRRPAAQPAQSEPQSSFPSQPDSKPAFPQTQPDTRLEPQGILPLESPTYTWSREPEQISHVHAPAPRRSEHGVRGSSYPPPVTTTSPPPAQTTYPIIMNGHQREQGYNPSLQSMFSLVGLATALTAERDAQAFGTPPKSSMNTPPALLFQPNPEPTPPGGKPQLPGGYGQTNTNGYGQQGATGYQGPNGYNTQPYGGPSANASGVPSYPSMPRPSSGPTSTTNYATRPPPAIPNKDVVHPLGPPPNGTYDPPQTQEDESDDGPLRQVLLPAEVIQKFMSIAKPNTHQNRETCGLLLGKKQSGVNGEKSRFAVTTLLVPRQRGTSDTCEMVEEELILDFQETRKLITLGWIHTHPTQSCFMSSLDLHTHSGYQVSLREAFAIVCAPSQSPNVGIFRLTDPPGLQVILKCTAKEAFHPHTSGNIYTDADQGHVKMMKNMELSIVDLRRYTG